MKPLAFQVELATNCLPLTSFIFITFKLKQRERNLPKV